MASMVYFGMKEQSCSEQSARMTAMDGASKNAGMLKLLIYCRIDDFSDVVRTLFVKGAGRLHSKETIADRVAQSVQASQDKPNNKLTVSKKYIYNIIYNNIYITKERRDEVRGE